MVTREQWGFRPDWLDYVWRSWVPGVGRAQRRDCCDDDSPELAQFCATAMTAFRCRGVPVREIKAWVSVQEPEDGTGYADSYPHFHYPLNSMCLVHYLEPGDKPAPLHIFDGDDVIEEITPVAGLTVVMPNSVKHGVLKNNGTTARVQMVAQAMFGGDEWPT